MKPGDKIKCGNRSPGDRVYSGNEIRFRDRKKVRTG